MRHDREPTGFAASIAECAERNGQPRLQTPKWRCEYAACVDSTSAWRAQRRDALATQAAALERRREAETAQARRLVQEFVRQMQARGVRPQPLRARVPHSGATYRTNIVGWYIRRDGSLGVDTDGRYYILDTSPSVASRVLGARLEPSDPPLVVGVGARDGESQPMEQLLRSRLDEVKAR